MEECLRKWKEQIHAERLQYSKLNHYTTQQLLLLRSHLASVRQTGLGEQVVVLQHVNLMLLWRSIHPGIGNNKKV